MISCQGGQETNKRPHTTIGVTEEGRRKKGEKAGNKEKCIVQ